MTEEDAKPWHARERSDSCRMFQGEPADREDYPARSDVLFAYTVLPGLLERFASAESLRSADFSKCGETFCYLKIDGINGLEGSAFGDRSDIEDALDEALRSSHVGCVIGAGTGLRYSYVDFAVMDVRVACRIIREVLTSGNIAKRSWVMFFDSERKDEWVGIWDETPAPPR